jgi:phosphatidylinositol 3-kinase
MLDKDILKYSPTYILSSEEKDLLWKFRFYLTRDKKGLTKFLKAVDWSDPIETEQAVTTLLPLWVDVDVEDMLELLGAQFQHREVRSFAVSKLEKADDEVISQCLR